MDIALVTGASSSLGIAISQRLISIGFRVYGLGGDYRNCPLRNSDFRPIPCDLSDGAQVMQEVVRILQKESGICLVVNNAKYFPVESIAEVSPKDLDRALRINLLTPLLIARCALPGLQKLQGFIINLGVAPHELSRGGVIGAATSGGLRAAHEAMFNEVRDYGVKVSMISPEPNRWSPSERNKAAEQKGEARLDPDAVASAVADLVLNKSKNLITEVVIRPRRWIDAQLPPVIDLPFPEPKPIPYTVPREVIEAEEQFDEQELDKAELKEERAARQKQKPSMAQPAAKAEEPVAEPVVVESNVVDGDSPDGEASAPRKKRRRRGGRGRNAQRREGEDAASRTEASPSVPSGAGGSQSPSQGSAKPAVVKKEPSPSAQAAPTSSAADGAPPARRKSRRNRNRSEGDVPMIPKQAIPGMPEQNKLSFKPSNEKRAHELLEARLRKGDAPPKPSSTTAAAYQPSSAIPGRKKARKVARKPRVDGENRHAVAASKPDASSSTKASGLPAPAKKATRKAAKKVSAEQGRKVANKAVKKAAKKAVKKTARKVVAKKTSSAANKA